ncbi:hypothetical protein BDF14DRAFT_756115 [Spinellus fusiger]|nr:hypothetical protein BDF14DRAFT_756115 [Spinellus fusiger]
MKNSYFRLIDISNASPHPDLYRVQWTWRQLEDLLIHQDTSPCDSPGILDYDEEQLISDTTSPSQPWISSVPSIGLSIADIYSTWSYFHRRVPFAEEKSEENVSGVYLPKKRHRETDETDKTSSDPQESIKEKSRTLQETGVSKEYAIEETNTDLIEETTTATSTHTRKISEPNPWRDIRTSILYS